MTHIPQSRSRSTSTRRAGRTCRALVVVATLLLSTATRASAEGFFSPFIGFNFGGDSANCASLTNCDEKRINWGASLGSVNGVFGFEEEIGYARDFFGKAPGADNALLTLMSNLMVVIPAGPIRPYGIIGLGLMRPHVKFDTSSLALEKNALGWDIGGGLNIFFGRSVGIRGDVRHLRTLQSVTLGIFGNDKVEFWRGSAGLVFHF